MPRYRMIVIDLDGTLLSPVGTVTEATRAAVHRVLDAGLLVCFATGRNWTESQAILDDIAHYDTAVFVGGAMVIDIQHRITLHRTAMEPALAAEVCAMLEAMGHAALALQDTAVAGVDYLATADVPMNEASRQWMRVTAAKINMVPRLGTHSHEHTIRVGICAEAAEVARVQALLKDSFGERILCQNLYVPTYGVEVLEVFDPAVNKWEGVLHVARRHGIVPEQIVAIGDDINDLPMVKNAGLGVAMGNAKPELLAAAKRVIGRNEEEGLASFLNELVDQHTVEPIAGS